MPAVLPETTVTATVWAVSSAPGGPYPASAARVHTMVAEANKILRQAAMKVVWNGTLCTTNRADWYNLVMTSRTPMPGTAECQLLNCSSGTGGIELYMVNSIIDMGKVALGVNDNLGMMLCAEADGHTLAHEVLHQCRLKDVFGRNRAVPVDGPVSAERLDTNDWGGGYYPQGLQQADLIEGRLLMCGETLPGSTIADIPYGGVYGYGYVSDESDELELKLVPVGRSNMTTRQPAHQ